MAPPKAAPKIQDAPPSKKTGRPTIFTEELAEAICEAIASGQAIRAICGQDGMPGISTLYRWEEQNPAFREQIACARRRAAQTLVDTVLERFSAARPADANLVGHHARFVQWLSGKYDPQRFGDRATVEHTGNLSLTQVLATLPTAAKTASEE